MLIHLPMPPDKGKGLRVHACEFSW